MPITVSELFKTAGLQIDGKIAWGELPKEERSGIYVVALSGEPNSLITLDAIPVSLTTIAEWINRASLMRIDNQAPTVETISNRLGEFWLSDETILYIAQTNRSLRVRIRELYYQVLGGRSRHCGGHWLKALENLKDLSFYYSIIERDQRKVEDIMLKIFHEAASSKSNENSYKVLMPFANRQAPAIEPNRKYYRKQHGITNQVI